MGHDRTDEIRAAVGRARRRGWAAQLAYASQLLDDEKDATLARAVIGSVRADIEAHA